MIVLATPGSESDSHLLPDMFCTQIWVPTKMVTRMAVHCSFTLEVTMTMFNVHYVIDKGFFSEAFLFKP